MIKRTNDSVTDRIFSDLQRQIDALKKAVNQPMQQEGSFFNGKDGDIRFIRGNDKKGYLEVKTSDGVYTTVTDIFQLMGKERPYPYFSDLLVDNLTAKTFTYKQMVGSNGDYVISDMAEVESVTDTTITFKDLSNLNVCPFAQYDCIQALRVNASTNAELRNIQATVSSVSGRTVTVTYTSVAKARVGDIFCRVGNTTTAGRQNIIYMSTIDNLSPTRAPFIDLYSAINNFTTYGTVFRTQPKVRVGNLVGITDSDFGGALTGYGLYADNAYLKGKIYLANNGAISLGKTAYTDTTNAGFWIGDSDATATINPYFYFGTASDAQYIKADLTAGTINTYGITITAGVVQTATSGDRTKLSSVGLEFYHGTGYTIIEPYGNSLAFGGGTINPQYQTYYNFVATGGWGIIERYVSPPLVVNHLRYLFTDSKLYFGDDVTLYRSAANVLKTDDALHVAGALFQVDINGDITKLKNITYSFPSVAPALNQILKCTNATGGVLTWSDASAASSITIANEASDTVCYPVFATDATGDLGLKSNAGLTFNSATALLTVTNLTVSNTITGSISGNAATVTNGVYTNATNTLTGANEFQSDIKLIDDFLIPVESGTVSTNTLAAAGKTMIAVDGTVTITSITGGVDGKIIYIRNSSADNVTITTAVISNSASNVVLGEGDVIMLIYSGSNWFALSSWDSGL